MLRSRGRFLRITLTSFTLVRSQVAIQDWPGLLGQCYDHCQPGGASRLLKGAPASSATTTPSRKTSSTWKWLTEFRRLSPPPLGFDIAPRLPALLEEAGFRDVELTQKVVPLGTWPKDRTLKELGEVVPGFSFWKWH